LFTDSSNVAIILLPEAVKYISTDNDMIGGGPLNYANY